MIEFRGELSEKNKKVLNKESTKGTVISMIFVSLIIFIVITILTLRKDTMFAIGYILIPVLIGGGFLPDSKKTQEIYCPIRISIDGDSIFIEGKKWQQKFQISKIKYIWDFGDYYRAIDIYHRKLFHFLCQKDLIVQGSIEEFEEMFADKIVRKHSK